MATKNITVNLDHAFFDKIFHKAYPKACDKTIATAKRMVSDGVLQIETLFELAVSRVGRLQRNSVDGMDFTDKSDAKKACVRTSGYGKHYTAPISQVHTKKGNLRVMVYERKKDKFYYFVFPRHSYSHITVDTKNIDIPFELDGTPRRVPKRKNVKMPWWAYEVGSFTEMARCKTPKKKTMRELIASMDQ